MAVLACVIASAGCETTYLVKSSDLDQLSTHPGAQVIPARRLDGTNVLLRTSLLPNPIAHFRRADALQRTGDYTGAAQELRTSGKLLDYASDDEWSELQHSISLLSNGRGAMVSVPSLRVVQRLGALAPTPTADMKIEVRNPKQTTGRVLAIIGGILTGASVPLSFAVAASVHSNDGGGAVDAMTTGIVFGVNGVVLLIAGAAVAVGGRHAAESDVALPGGR
jgi:hypothetical protein